MALICQPETDFLRPVCAVCKRPVDSFGQFRDDLEMRTYFVARCHGAEQAVKIDDTALRASIVRPGVAFEHEALPDAPERLSPSQATSRA